MVKENMKILASLTRQPNRSNMKVQVFYLRWLGNMDDEVLMQEYAESLGYTFESGWTWMSPIEKNVALLMGEADKITATDLETYRSLTRPFESTIVAAEKYANFGRCPYFYDYLVLDCAGNVSLCCGVYDQKKYTIGSYLGHEIGELLDMKSNNHACGALCEKCMGYGLPAIGLAAELDKLATLNVLNRYAGRLGISLN